MSEESAPHKDKVPVLKLIGFFIPGLFFYYSDRILMTLNLSGVVEVHV